MAKIYASLIRKEMKGIEDVPEKIKEQVLLILEENGIE